MELDQLAALVVIAGTVVNTVFMAVTRAAVAELRAEIVDRLAEMAKEIDRDYARHEELEKLDGRLHEMERERWKHSRSQA